MQKMGNGQCKIFGRQSVSVKISDVTDLKVRMRLFFFPFISNICSHPIWFLQKIYEIKLFYCTFDVSVQNLRCWWHVLENALEVGGFGNELIVGQNLEGEPSKMAKVWILPLPGSQDFNTFFFLLNAQSEAYGNRSSGFTYTPVQQSLWHIYYTCTLSKNSFHNC